MIIDNITLGDLIEFQKVDYEILRSYDWNGLMDYTIQDKIKKNLSKEIRLQKTKKKIILYKIYKLKINSC